jgi:arsenate reductase (thioredoxin)
MNNPGYVIFVCERAEQACPHTWPFALQSLCWPFDAPASHQGDHEDVLQRFRNVRDQIDVQITEWLATHPETV